MQDKKQQLLILAAFAAGVAVGAKWPHIQKKIEPLLQLVSEYLKDIYGYVARFLAEQSEALADKAAEEKHAKREKSSKATLGESEFIASLDRLMASDKETKVVSKKKRQAKSKVNADSIDATADSDQSAARERPPKRKRQTQAEPDTL
jgi:hypothetical protein